MSVYRYRLSEGIFHVTIYFVIMSSIMRNQRIVVNGQLR